MEINFYKYQGTGNDFIIIDDRTETFDISNHKLVARLCNRKFGIGADGLVLLRDHPEHDFSMVYFNADGREGSLCGNGGRCIVHFANFLGLFTEKTTFLAADGVHEAFIEGELIHLKMNDITEIKEGRDHFFLDTGSPHYVKFVGKLSEFPVYEAGKKVRYSDDFKPGGTNVNFLEIIDGHLHVRTYERGVENETYSCGTGVTAAAIISSKKQLSSPIKIKTIGGDLQVSFQKEHGTFKNVYLIGPAMMVFKGAISI